MLNKKFILSKPVYLQKQKRIGGMEKITVEAFTKNGNLTIEKQILNYFVNLYWGYSTNYSDTGKIQCNGGEDRNIGDILGILRSYNNIVTEKEVMQSLYNIIMSRVLGTRICSNTSKRVYFHKFHAYRHLEDEDRKDEHGLIFSQYNFISGKEKIC